MNFLYNSDISSIADCPPDASGRQIDIGYRFVFDPICSNSFLPQAKKPGARSGFNGFRCTDFALSMFTTEAHARNKFDKIKKRYPNIGKSLGDHLAKIDLDSNMGHATKVRRGHFDLHPYERVDFLSKSRLLGAL